MHAGFVAWMWKSTPVSQIIVTAESRTDDDVLCNINVVNYNCIVHNTMIRYGLTVWWNKANITCYFYSSYHAISCYDSAYWSPPESIDNWATDLLSEGLDAVICLVLSYRLRLWILVLAVDKPKCLSY